MPEPRSPGQTSLPHLSAGARVYITQEYRDGWATVNSLWAAARQHGYLPDSIILLSPSPDSKRAKQLVDALEAVQDALGKTAHVDVERIDPVDLAGTRTKVENIIRARKREMKEVAVDVTPGRTLSKLGVFQACLTERPTHVFYLDVAGYDYRSQPYVLVPRRLQHSRDLLDEVVGNQ